jgi:hypothetical protein
VSNSFYINAGTPNTVAHQHTLLSSSFNGQLGAEPQDNYRLNGNLDGVTFWDRAITENEIYALYNSSNGREYPYSSTISADIPSTNDSVGTNNGTAVGGLTYTTGKIGQAFQFNGTNAYVSFPTNSWNSLVGTDLTISLWVKFASTGDQTLVSNMSSPSINVWSGWEIRLVGGRPTIYMWNNSGTGVGAQGGVISTNTWYHIVATRKKGSRTRIYINGSLAQTDTNTPDPSISGTYYPNIGHLQYSSTYHGLYTTSGTLIDSVNLWSKEISDDEVVQLYNSGNGSKYPFSTQTLPSVANQLGVDNGTLMNGCTFGDGKIGKAFQFDGVNDLVELPTNSCNFSGDFSYSFWFNLASTGGYPSLISNYRNAGGDFGYFIRMNPSNKIEVCGYANSTPSFSLATLTTFSTNTWYHVSVTKSSSSVKIYVNGTLDRTTSVGAPMVYFSTMYTAIGCLYKWNGSSSTDFVSNGSKIDAVNVWQKELTQSEVTELYNSGNGKQITAIPIVQNGLLFNLDASRTSSYVSGTTWYDNSGNGNNGTFYPAVIVPNIGTNGVAYWQTGVKRFSFNGVDGSYGSNSYLKIPLSTTIDANGYTFGGWVKSTTSDTSTRILKGADGIYGGWALALSISSTDVWVTICNVHSQSPSLTATSVVTQNNWYYVICRYNHKSELKLYVNGVAVATLPQATPITNSNEISLRTSPGWVIGAFSTSVTYKSTVSTFHSYNRVLTDAEILQNFNSTKSVFGY